MMRTDRLLSPNIDLSRHVKLPHTGDDTGHYSVRLDSIKIGSVTLGNGGIAAIDTGSTNLWIPEEVSCTLSYLEDVLHMIVVPYTFIV